MRTRIAALIVLTACGAPPAPKPIPTDQPFKIGGASVRCPPGTGWRVVDRSDEAVVFERPVANGKGALTAMAQLFPYEFTDLEECRQSLQRDEYVATATHRNPHGTVKLVADAKPPYVQVRYTAEQASSIRPDAEWSLVTTEFRWFLRPGDNRGLMLSFAERRPLDTPPTEFATQASLFFASLALPSAAATGTTR